MRMFSEEESRGLTASSGENLLILDYGAASEDSEHSNHAADSLAAHDRLDRPDPGDEETEPLGPDETQAAEVAVAALTRRLRILFHVITWPIVPLGMMVLLSLLWMLSAALREIHSACAHPLHWYAGASLLLAVYTPYHTTVRAYLFRYRRDRDGPHRPPPVRRCDQTLHTVALLYVYAGVTLVQTCREDAVDGCPSACTATCPALFSALSVYVLSLEVFTLSLVLPLLGLPCLYLWLLRQATLDTDALAILQERLRDDELFLRNHGATAEEVLAHLEPVRLVAATDQERVWIVPRGDKDLANAEESNGVKECCICMNDFVVDSSVDIEAAPGTGSLDRSDPELVVRTHCGHIMHGQCMSSWIDGRWQGQGPGDEALPDASLRRARRTTCPLCRNDLRSGR